MGRKIIFATGNEDKMKEIRMIMKNDQVEILSMKEAGIDADIVENGSSFEENALIKVRTVRESIKKYADYSEAIILGEDSGLEIDYLDKAPGILSARYMGKETPYTVKNASIIERLSGVPMEKRTARFVCAAAAALPDGTTFTVRGTMEGFIGYESRGENGFGYDPIFYLPEYGCSSAELPPDQKNKISHRGKALRSMYKMMKEREML